MSLSPSTDVDDAVDYVDHYPGFREDLELAISEELLDPAGFNMAILTYRVLALVVSRILPVFGRSARPAVSRRR